MRKTQVLRKQECILANKTLVFCYFLIILIFSFIMLFVFEIFYDLIIVSFIICILVNDALHLCF